MTYYVSGVTLDPTHSLQFTIGQQVRRYLALTNFHLHDPSELHKVGYFTAHVEPTQGQGPNHEINFDLRQRPVEENNNCTHLTAKRPN